jgi:hypothetical protein
MQSFLDMRLAAAADCLRTYMAVILMQPAGGATAAAPTPGSSTGSRYKVREADIIIAKVRVTPLQR